MFILVGDLAALVGDLTAVVGDLTALRSLYYFRTGKAGKKADEVVKIDLSWEGEEGEEEPPPLAANVTPVEGAHIRLKVGSFNIS
jgi:hypothetical protein